MRIFRNRHMRWPWLTTLGYDRAKLMDFRWYGRVGLMVLFVVMALSSMAMRGSPQDVTGQLGAELEHGLSSRHLLSVPGDPSPTTLTDCNSIVVNHSAHGMSWERCDFEMANVKELWVLIHAIGIFIIFVALAIICDDFFVPSLEAISEKLRLSEDVAGATFMAAGSSAPELFTSIVGVAFETDVGVGTIVGSAVFNILIIIALTAALAGQVLSLDWRPMFRDGFYYGLSITLFIVFCWDGTIVMYEAVILLVLYMLYIVIMVFNHKLMDLLGSFQRRSSMVEPTANGNVDAAESQTSGPAPKVMSMTGGHARRLSVLSQTHRSSLHDIQADKHVFHHAHHGGLAGNFTFTVHNGDIPDISTLPRPTPQRVLDRLATRTTSWTDLRSASDRESKRYLHQGPRTQSLASETPRQSAPTGRADDSASYQNGRRNSADSPRGPSQIIIRPSSVSANFVVTEYLKDKSYTPLPDTDTPPPPDRRLHIHEPDFSATTCSPQSYFTFHQHVTSPDSTATPPARHPSVIEERDDERASTPNEPKTSDTEIEEEEEEPTIRLIPCLPAVRTAIPAKPLKGAGTAGVWFCYVVKMVLFILSFPFVCLFSWTIPDCSKDHNRKYFLASFILSVTWIAVLSVGMVTLVSRAGCILGVDTYTMGLVVVAIGTSVPDALSSILVARDGYGDMAVSNAIGSNVFDIDLGLGLPFIIAIAIRGPVKLLAPFDECLRNTGQLLMTQHAKFGFILMFILVLTIITFAVARFKLTRGIGITFVCIYILFLAYAFIQEFYCQGVFC